MTAMTTTDAMLRTHPWPGELDRGLVAGALDALLGCARACVLCADACLADEEVAGLRTCIGATLVCGDVCVATSRVLSRCVGADTSTVLSQLAACSAAATACAAECARHAEMHEHCRICADACGRTVTVLTDLRAALVVAPERA